MLTGGKAVLLSVLVAIAASRAAHAHANGRPSTAAPLFAETLALKFLKSLPRKWSGTSARDCETYADKNIDRLSPAFAMSAARFLHAFVEAHGHVTITSAHRTAQEQACVCEGEKGPCAGRPRITKTKKGRRIVKRGGSSRHQSGIALDVRAGTGTDDEFVCLHEFAQFNPQFGVHFPLGKRDRPHMEPAANHGPVRLAAIGMVRTLVKPCARLKVMLVDTPAD